MQSRDFRHMRYWIGAVVDTSAATSEHRKFAELSENIPRLYFVLWRSPRRRRELPGFGCKVMSDACRR